MSEKILLRHEEVEGIRALETYVADGGYETARKVFAERAPAEIVDEVKSSGLRGRGGAGFPTGMK